MQIIKHPTVKVNKEIMWKYHEAIQEQIKPLNEWYKLNLDIVQEIDDERQKIVRKYYQFEKGQLKLNDQKQYVLIKGMKVEDYDKEMEALMTGEVELQDNGAIKWPTSFPAPQMEVVQENKEA